MILVPGTEAEFVEAVAALDEVFTPCAFRPFSRTDVAPNLTFDHYGGVVDYSPPDQVITVRSGTTLSELNEILEQNGQCVPHLFPHGFADASLAEMLDFKLPHLLEGQCGSLRDWVLGARVILPNGTICKCGSKVVKNVAGYDIHKMLIGARGALALILEVTLRVFSKSAVPAPVAVKGPARWDEAAGQIDRCLPTEFERLAASLGDRLVMADPASSTLWSRSAGSDEPRSFVGNDAWRISSGSGEDNLSIANPDSIHFTKRAKRAFDPTNKFNPGALGAC